ncbi:hypothetical protein RJ639_033005 [Escallonia herrerae]|uniref:MADS-box domain-containing protein n=1 Tax=Escallonia herrerae TaxID=1293975 RepID=A0AA88WX30_9ASTE|nr:hypothetical protein RJ639_033005 [Escallonia herrerae]
MGRKKLQMKRIADKNRRLVTFSKRRSGLLKRARDLSVLCDVQVAAVVFSGRGKLYDFSSGTNCSMHFDERVEDKDSCDRDIIKLGTRYDYHYTVLPGSTLSSMPIMCGEYNFLSYSVATILQRYLDGPNAEEVSVTDLIQLEEQLDAALTQTRSRKIQFCHINLNRRNLSTGMDKWGHSVGLLLVCNLSGIPTLEGNELALDLQFTFLFASRPKNISKASAS